jgi:hypothetical protein
MVHRLESDYWERVDFVYLYQSDPNNQPLFDRYGLRGRPIFLLLRADGAEVQRWYGYVDEFDLRAG